MIAWVRVCTGHVWWPRRLRAARPSLQHSDVRDFVATTRRIRRHLGIGSLISTRFRGPIKFAAFS